MKNFTVKEKVLIEIVFKNNNINQSELARKLNTTLRKVRILVNSIRKKGWISFGGVNHWLVADNNGYSLCRFDEQRVKSWSSNFESKVLDMQQILNTFRNNQINK